MNALRLASFALLAMLATAACSGEVSQVSSSTSSATGTGGGGGAGGAATGGAATGGAGGALPSACPEILPAPQGCGEFADWCGNATPLAAGGDLTVVSGAVLTTSHVWFVAGYSDLGPCKGFFYRVPKDGGDAQQMFATDDISDIEADGDTLYLVERTDDYDTRSISVIVGDQRQKLGEIHNDPSFNTYFDVALALTPGGIVTYDPMGPKKASFFHVTLAGLTPIPADMPDAYLGSVPAYDGKDLFLSISDSPFVSTDGALWHMTLARISASAPVSLSTNAEERVRPTVAIDADSVFFATGDPSNVDAGMGISRVAKTGGAATPLFPPGTVWIDQVLLDDTDVYFRGWDHEPAVAGIWAVPKAGGPLRHVWTGRDLPTSSLWMDAQNLYFSVDGRKNAGEITGPGGFVVRVAKSTSLP
ncbi:MAG: hypothetical protein QM820_65710 [Minicystis sp.]